MKKALVLLFLAAPCMAKPVLTILGGASIPMSDIEVEGGGSDDIGKPGDALGLQLMFPLDDRLSVGIDLLSHDYGKKASDVLLSPLHTEYEYYSRSFLASARYAWKRNKLQPFLFAGIGIHIANLTADLKPQPGLVWVDTGTAEKRRIVDDSDTAFAGAAAVGLDYEISQRVRLGFEARYSYLGNTDFETKSISQSFDSVGEIDADSSDVSLLGRLSFAF